MFKSVEEIDKLYSEHLESLRMSGVTFNEGSVLAEWRTAVKEFEENA